jgi:hypothetical protein
MGTDRHVPLLHRWFFLPVERSGFITWRWEARNYRDDVVLESAQDFDTYTACVEDAEAAGYVPPEKRQW